MTKEKLTEVRNAVNLLASLSDAEWKEIEGACIPKHEPAKLQNQNKFVKNEDEVNLILKKIGILPHLKGYRYLKRAIMLCLDDPGMIDGITKELYPAVARAYDSTISRVERAIRHSIERIWEREENLIEVEEIFGHRRKLTNSEFIAGIVNYIDPYFS